MGLVDICIASLAQLTTLGMGCHEAHKACSHALEYLDSLLPVYFADFLLCIHRLHTCWG